MNSLLFEPWIGPEYGQSKYGRLLIVGESHYFLRPEYDYLNYTKKVIGGLGNSKEEDNNFYIKVGKIFKPDNYLDIWPKVAFANAIQYPYQQSRADILPEHYKTVEPAIREYLERTRPSKMIVFSMGIWRDGLPPVITWGNPIENLEDPIFKRRSNVWKFEYKDGACYGIGVHHPSSIQPPFNPDEWRPLIEAFLKRQYE